MYAYVLNLWINRQISREDVIAHEKEGRISQEEKNFILATPQQQPKK